MKLFGQIVRTAVNTALLPAAIVEDVYEIATGNAPEHLSEALERLKDEAGEDCDEEDW